MEKYESNEILHVKKGALEYLQFKALNEYNVKHCITLRRGGKSKGIYESLNFRILGQDEKENVLENVNIVKDTLKFSDICKCRQDHTDRVIEISPENKDKYLFEKYNGEKADGYIITQKEIATLITTADCNPIIIYDKRQNIVVNVHAGWKGVINKIYINGINKLIQKYNSNVEDIIVCIGPSIRSCCFSSQEELFKKKFTDVFKYEENYLEYEKDGTTFHIDLIYILKHELKNIGIKDPNIHVADICTRCNPNDFFSYRYAIQNNYPDYATMATIVELGENNVK